MGHLYFAFQGSRDSIGYTFFGNRAGDELQFYAIFHSISVTIDWFIAAVKSQCAAAGYFYIIINSIQKQIGIWVIYEWR